MENDFKIFFTVSLLIHVSIFTAFGFRTKRSAYIVMPIDLLLNSSDQQENASKTAQLQQNPPAEIKKKKEKEIVIPKKPKAIKPLTQKAEPAQQEENKPKQAAVSQAKPQASGFSGAIIVDTARFPYAYYTNIIVRNIGRHWQWSNEFGRLTSVIYFKILRDGTVSEVNVKDSSGDKLFDDQALRAVKLAGFPPLPEGYADSDLGVYFEFSYRE